MTAGLLGGAEDVESVMTRSNCSSSLPTCISWSGMAPPETDHSKPHADAPKIAHCSGLHRFTAADALADLLLNLQKLSSGSCELTTRCQEASTSAIPTKRRRLRRIPSDPPTYRSIAGRWPLNAAASPSCSIRRRRVSPV